MAVKIRLRRMGQKKAPFYRIVVSDSRSPRGMVNSGPVLTSGHIAIRCMVHTKMLFRNLKVYNRSQFEAVRELQANK